jgi:hypothetical protein
MAANPKPAATPSALEERLAALERDNAEKQKQLENLKTKIKNLELEVEKRPEPKCPECWRPDSDCICDVDIVGHMRDSD